MSLPHAHQALEPLSFYSGHSPKTQPDCATLKKDELALMGSFQRSRWLASSYDCFNFFTDRDKLIFIFDPSVVLPVSGQATTRKALRWAVKTSAYNYVCLLITGNDNVWAYFVTCLTALITIFCLVPIPSLPTTFCDFGWPYTAVIHASQETFVELKPSTANFEQGLWRFIAETIWIYDDHDDLQLRSCIIAHTGATHHRGIQAALGAISKTFACRTMKEDVRLLFSPEFIVLNNTA